MFPPILLSSLLAICSSASPQALDVGESAGLSARIRSCSVLEFGRGADAVHLTTTAIRRGRTLLSSEPRSCSGERGAAAIDRGGIKETLGASGGGFEHAYRFARRPKGAGDLEITVAVEGRVLTEAGGVLLRSGETRLSYGEATWVDAAGRKWPAQRTVSRGRIVLRVAASVLEASRYPAVLDPLVSPEIGTDTPSYVPSGVGFARPTAVAVGSNFLVSYPLSGGIFVTRVNSAGTQLELPSVRIAPAAAQALVSVAATDGSVALVVWSDQRSDRLGDIYAARVRTDGTILDPTGFVVAQGPDAQWPMGVAWDGAQFVVLWQQSTAATTPTLRLTRVKPDGTVLDPAGLPLGVSLPGNLQGWSLACEGPTCLVTWGENQGPGDTNVLAVVTRSDGTGITPKFTISSGMGNQGDPVAAAGKGQFLVGFSDSSRGLGDAMATRVTAAGAVLDPAGIPLGVDPRKFEDVDAISWNGTQFMVGLHRGGADVALIRVNPDGTVADSTPVSLSGPPSNAARLALAWDGTQHFGVWLDDTLRGARIQTDRTALDAPALNLSWKQNEQRDQAVASNGSGYLAVYCLPVPSPLGGAADIRAVRVTGTGTVLDSNGALVIGRANIPCADLPLAAASDGTDYLVVWSDHTRPGTTTFQVAAARVLSDGTVLPPVMLGTPSNAEPMDLSVAFGAKTWAVAWGRGYYSNSGSSVVVARVAQDGTALDTVDRIVAGSAPSADSPVIDFDGTQFFLAFHYATTQSSHEIRGRRMLPDGTFVDAQPLPLVGVNAWLPSLAFDGTNHLLVWAYVGSPEQIRAERVAKDGSILDTTPLTVANLRSSRARVVFDSPNYLVGIHTQNSFSGPVEVVRVTPGGVVLDPVRRPLVTAESDRDFAIASSGHGQSMVTYCRLDGSDDVQNFRVRSRLVSVARNLANGTNCFDASECASGFCVDQVCCDVACGGSDPADCQACSVAAGAPSNGTCAPFARGTVCRAAKSVCDFAESCDGNSGQCPSDLFAAPGIVCRSSKQAICDPEEKCTGTSPLCPTDVLAPKNTVCSPARGPCENDGLCSGSACGGRFSYGTSFVCRKAAGPCDVDERCPVSGYICPTDVLKPAGTVCALSGGECDPADECDGASAMCPATVASDGTSCSSGMCLAGQCATPPDAGSPDAQPAQLDDAGTEDAGLNPDVGAADDAGAASDAAAPGASDAALTDAADVNADASEVDADASLADAGKTPDLPPILEAPPSDAGEVADGAEPSPTVPTTADPGQTGCGCGTGSGETSGLGLLILAMAVLFRRRARG